MSATRDLIAAALTVAGAVRWQYPELSDELRELCARAMVQPDVSEVERLLEAYDHEYASGGSVEDYDRARAALLDYVRGVIAEQEGGKCVPVGWTLVPIEPTRGMLDAYVKNGARFNSARSDWAAMLAAAPQPARTAEVPLPEAPK